ncbi:MAG: DUF805 domain-containing protein [Selenomonadaceae bacterium]|nr:DUF805 domain-containing protein [Selenomonadaceae bacterium]
MELINEIYTTEGRLNRLRYFKYYLILVLVSAVIAFVVGFIGGFITGNPESILVKVPGGIISLITSIGGIMLGIRRLHDLNKSGWFMLLLLVPLVNLLFLLYLWFMPGTQGYNRYGEDPLANQY